MPGDGTCETGTGNGICTLRAAIEEASAFGGPQSIDLPAGIYVLSVTGTCDGVALCMTGTPTMTAPASSRVFTPCATRFAVRSMHRRAEARVHTA